MSSHLLIITESGFGKRVPVDEVRRTNRGARGVNASRDKVAVAIVVNDPDADLVLATAEGKVERVAVASIPVRRRANRKTGAISKGIRVIRPGRNDRVASGSLATGVETPAAGLLHTLPTERLSGLRLALGDGESVDTGSMVTFGPLRPIEDLVPGGDLAVDRKDWASGEVHACSSYWCSRCGLRHQDPEAAYRCIDAHVAATEAA
jgi:hypothetical protein